MSLSWREIQEREQRDLALLQERKQAMLDPVQTSSLEGELVEQRSAAGEIALSRGSSLGAFRAGAWSQPLSLAQTDREAFRASAVVYRCAMAVASPAASLELAVQHADQTEYDFENPIARMFNKRPNPYWTAASYKLLAWLHLELVGQHFGFMDRGPTGLGEVQEVWPIFDPVELVVDDRTDPLRPQLLGGRVLHGQGSLGVTSASASGLTPLLPSELLWLRYPDPADPWGCMSPLRAAAWDIDLDNYARQWQAGEFRNGSTPPGVVFLGDIGDEQFEQIQAGFSARNTGPMNARRMLFMSGAVKPDFVRLGLTSVEMSYLQSRDANASGIMRAFGVSKDLLDGAATYENRREAKIHLWTETILPKLQIVESEIDRQLLPEEVERAVFDTRRVDALKENADSISKRTAQDFKSGYILIDEARERIGLAKLPNDAGQKLFVPRGAQDAAESEVGALEPAGEGATSANEAQGSDQSGERGQLVSVPPVIPTETRARSARPLDRGAIQRAYERFSAVGERSVRRLAEKQETVLFRNLERQRKRGEQLERRAGGEDLFDEPYWRGVSEETLGEWLTQVYEAGGDRTAAALDLNFASYTDRVTQRMRARLDYLAGRVTETTAEAIRQALLEPGVEAGESVPDLAERLRSVFEELRSSRAEAIARTETVSGFNAASREVAKGSDVVSGKRWLAAADDRVRDSHAAMDGEEVALDEPYSNGLMHPGDPEGAPEEVINCRCVEEYVLAPESDQERGRREGLQRRDLVTSASGMTRSPLIDELHVHVHQGDQHHDIHVAEGAIHNEHHMHHTPRIDARTTVARGAVQVESPKPSKRVKVTGPDGKTTTLERSDG